MTVSIQLPNAIEEQLRRTVPNLEQVAKEAALVDLYRAGKLTHHELAVALELDRFETEQLLSRHRVTEDLISADEYAQQLASVRGLSGT